jgi:hypothetical protein
MSYHIGVSCARARAQYTQLDVRAGMYCTDVAKAISAPIFHVNGDDVDAVVRVRAIMLDASADLVRRCHDWQQIIDFSLVRTSCLISCAIDGSSPCACVCVFHTTVYSEGHNETDQPKFTQPRMYSVIEKHPVGVSCVVCVVVARMRVCHVVIAIARSLRWRSSRSS